MSASRVPVSPESMVAEGATSVQARLVEGERVSEWAAGALDREGTPIVPGTRFRAASITKVLVATAVMRLVEAGRVSLDDRVEDHLPGRFGESGEADIRQVLGHTGGVPDYTGAVPLWNPDCYPESAEPGFGTRLQKMLVDERTADEIAELMRALPRDRDAIGTFSYSNGGYRMLAELIESLTRAPYGEHLSATIFEPLGMHDSLIPGRLDDLPAPAARAWHDLAPYGEGTVEVTRFSPTLIGAGGELISSTRDLSTFLRALGRGELVSASTLELMRDTSVASPRLADYGLERYGLGIIGFATDHGLAHGGGGSIDGYSTAMYESADGRRHVVVAAAEGELPFLELAARVASLTRALLEHGADAIPDALTPMAER